MGEKGGRVGEKGGRVIEKGDRVGEKGAVWGRRVLCGERRVWRQGRPCREGGLEMGGEEMGGQRYREKRSTPRGKGRTPRPTECFVSKACHVFHVT